MNKITYIDIEEYMDNRDEYILFDVRSPMEFMEDHIEGAINIPILNNFERKEVGTIHKEKGSKAAKSLAKEFLLPKLNKFLAEFDFHLDSKKKALIYCARGGDRSEVTATFLTIEHDNIYKLLGGYKKYRNYVLNFFASSFRKNVKVLYGYTGTGKTEILVKLKRLGIPVIDLEGLANNRGSVFGHIGLGKQPNQKKFDSDLFNAINKIDDDYIVVEGESKKIGRVYIPEGFYVKMIDGESYLITSSIKNRTERIIEEYGGFLKENRNEITRSIMILKDLLGKNVAEELIESFYQGKLEEVVEYLLINYYDILYKKNRKVKSEYLKEYSSDNLEYCINLMSQDLTGR